MCLGFNWDPLPFQINFDEHLIIPSVPRWDFSEPVSKLSNLRKMISQNQRQTTNKEKNREDFCSPYYWSICEWFFQIKKVQLEAGMGMGRDCQSQGFLFLGFECQSWKSWDCPNYFCPSPKSPKDLCPMGRLWDSQNSWDCLGLESQGQSRDFGIFYKNMIYSSHFFNMNTYCTQSENRLTKLELLRITAVTRDHFCGLFFYQ